MTLKGKRKALNDNPQAQIAAIAEAFGGRVPTKPLYRRYPGAVWQEGDTYHIAKLRKGELYHSIAKTEPVGSIFRDGLSACGYLAKTYYLNVSLQDLQAAMAGPVSIPTLAEAQQAIVCWVKDQKQTKYSPTVIWEYCIVTSDGIKRGTTQGKPQPVKGYPGAFIMVSNTFQCRELLRQAFRLEIQESHLNEAITFPGKLVKVPKIIGI